MATDILGTISSSAKGAPGVPTNVTATDVGTNRAFNNGAATVSFTAGAGATATSFTVTSSPGSYTASGSSSPITVEGLQSNTSYTFTVTGTNASGTSNPSSASASMTATTVPATPSAPTVTTAALADTVSWSAPANGGKAITGYTWASSDAKGATVGSGTTSVVVTQEGDTSQTYTVYATNDNGNSGTSNASNSVTTPPFFPPFFPFFPPYFPNFCVHGDTEIRTSNGYVKAKDIQVGEKLVSYTFNELPLDRDLYNIETWSSESITEDTVVETSVESIKIRQVAVTIMLNESKTRRFSLEHMLLARRGDTYMFIQAGTLKIGDFLVYDIEDRMTDVEVQSIGFLDEDVDVYDFSVTPYDLFIAGDVIAHNKKALFQGPTIKDTK